VTEEILLALICKAVEDRMRLELDASHSSFRGPRGFPGIHGESGPAGKDFSFEDNEEKIRSILKEVSLKFSDLSFEEIESLRGPQGKDGLSGKDFSWEDHKVSIECLVKEHSLTFDKLTVEQQEAIRGRPGRDGKDGKNGKDFNFDESLVRISDLISKEIRSIHDSLKLKFTDLSDEEKKTLKGFRGPRGHRGQRGHPGKDFVFEDHLEFFKSLKMKFSDLSDDDKSELKLRFKDLTEGEISGLKLKFSDLSDEEINLLRGHRGPRGQKGPQGIKGDAGKDGKDGVSVRGKIGPSGIDGAPGKNGIDGKDAPKIDQIDIDEHPDDLISIRVWMSDGSLLETNRVKLPKKIVQTGTQVIQYVGGGGSGSGGNGNGTESSPYTSLNVKRVRSGIFHRIPEDYENVVTREQVVEGILIVDGVNTIL
jgi:hypothetical protein